MGKDKEIKIEKGNRNTLRKIRLSERYWKKGTLPGIWWEPQKRHFSESANMEEPQFLQRTCFFISSIVSDTELTLDLFDQIFYQGSQEFFLGSPAFNRFIIYE